MAPGCHFARVSRKMIPPSNSKLKSRALPLLCKISKRVTCSIRESCTSIPGVSLAVFELAWATAAAEQTESLSSRGVLGSDYEFFNQPGEISGTFLVGKCDTDSAIGQSLDPIERGFLKKMHDHWF